MFCGTLPTYAVSTGAAAPASPFRRIDAARRKLLASISSYTTRDTKRPGETPTRSKAPKTSNPARAAFRTQHAPSAKGRTEDIQPHTRPAKSRPRLQHIRPFRYTPHSTRSVSRAYLRYAMKGAASRLTALAKPKTASLRAVLQLRSTSGISLRSSSPPAAQAPADT